ncbi:MAG: dihydropteroate synthase [Candidatus Eisenbacteria bacterium]
MGRTTRVMAIVNCTPDSFSDGGALASPLAIERRIAEALEDGADFLDIGGESTRPGAPPVPAEEEWARVAPAFEAARRLDCGIPISIDTTKLEVARRALDAGATIVNDVSALRFSPGIAALCAKTGAGLVLMHMRGDPRTMQDDPRYDDVVAEVREALAATVATARAAGVASDRILVDPGIGFGKTVEHNLELIRHAAALDGLGAGILIGSSRKGFIGKLLDLPVGERLEGSLATFVCAVLAGAHAVRVHDVRAAARAVRIADAVRGDAAHGDDAGGTREEGDTGEEGGESGS